MLITHCVSLWKSATIKQTRQQKFPEKYDDVWRQYYPFMMAAMLCENVWNCTTSTVSNASMKTTIFTEYQCTCLLCSVLTSRFLCRPSAASRSNVLGQQSGSQPSLQNTWCWRVHQSIHLLEVLRPPTWAGLQWRLDLHRRLPFVREVYIIYYIYRVLLM